MCTILLFCDIDRQNKMNLNLEQWSNGHRYSTCNWLIRVNPSSVKFHSCWRNSSLPCWPQAAATGWLYRQWPASQDSPIIHPWPPLSLQYRGCQRPWHNSCGRNPMYMSPWYTSTPSSYQRISSQTFDWGNRLSFQKINSLADEGCWKKKFSYICDITFVLSQHNIQTSNYFPQFHFVNNTSTIQLGLELEITSTAVRNSRNANAVH